MDELIVLCHLHKTLRFRRRCDDLSRIALVISSSHLPKTPETISEIRDHDTTSYQGLVSLIVTLDLSLYT